MALFRAVVLLSFSLLAPVLGAATFTVNSTGDVSDPTPDGTCDSGAGVCTLREAIEEANALAGGDVITFTVSGVIVKDPALSPFLTATEAVLIDGESSPAFVSSPVVTLNGFTLELEGAGGSEVRGLEIVGSAADGVYIDSPSNIVRRNWIGDVRGGVFSGNFGHGIEVDVGGGAGNVIEGNYISGNLSAGIQNGNDGGLSIAGNVIGLRTDGITPSPNFANGINVLGDNATVGGALAAQRNVISNNVGVQVYIGPLVQSTVVQGNYIGTNVAGTAGSTNFTATHGVEQHGNGTLIKGNVISGNPRTGISLPENGNLGTVIESNLIGLQPNGTTPLTNGDQGIEVVDEDGALIGGASAAERNVITGNTTYAIEIGAAADGTVIKSNFIGTDSSGNVAIPPPLLETIVVFGTNTDIGGALAGNVISGGSGVGSIAILGNGTDVFDNWIGIGSDGATPISGPVIGTVTNGIYVAAANTRIGLAGLGNTIGNHGADGIHIVTTASATAIEGNLIGVRVSGATAAPNLSDGIENHGTTTLITNNLISGNGGHGIHLPDDGSAGTIIRSNSIGLNGAQTAAVPNNLTGIYVAEDGVQIGNSVLEGNTIAGNVRSGIDVRSTATGTQILGNFIGVNQLAPPAAIGNGEHGIWVRGTDTLIGNGAATRNVIGGNTTAGVHVEGANTLIRGNHIGTHPTGAMLGNIVGIAVVGATNTTIGGPGLGNYIANNSTDGISLLSASGVSVQGNHIGLDTSGADAGNLGAGIRISGGSAIGIGDTTAGNVISGNDGWGIEDVGGTSNLTIAGNTVGLNPAGTIAVPNSDGGVLINSDGVVIGGATVTSRNYISGNGSLFPPGQNVLVESLADGTLIQNNVIGLASDGDTAVVNAGDGIRVLGNNTNILSNVVSGNGNGRGINIAGLTGAGTIIRGNIVGLNAAGTAARENYYGVTVVPGNVVIGGLAAGAGNVISGNNQVGLELSSDNSVHGNVIGLNAAGTAAVPNLTGVVLSGSNNVFGADGGANHIAHNTNQGIAVLAGNRNYFTRNSIHDNGQLGIDLSPIGVTPNDAQDPDEGPNHLQNYPVLTSAYLQGSTATITGILNSTPTTTFRLEFFSDTNPVATAEGRTYLGAWTVTTDASGNAPFVYSPVTAPPAGVSLTATAAPPDESTSEFSAAIVLLAPGVFDLSSATYSGSEAAGPITITVNRTGGSDGTVTVDYTTTNGSATAGEDYSTTTGTLTFGPGVVSQQFNVPVTNDGTFEGDETFTVTISNPTSGALLGTTTSATVTITDDEGMPALSIGDATGSETSLSVGFVITLSHPSTQPVTFQFATADVTTTLGSDYTGLSGSRTIDPGSTSIPISISVLDDGLAEPAETFTLNLSAPTGATILDGTGTGTILDNEGPVSASIDDETISENGATAIFTVTLSGPSGTTVEVNYTTTGITATPGSDYSTATGTIAFGPGVTVQEIFVPILDDTAFEADETFRVNLTSTAITILDGEGIGTITNDDAPGADLTLTISAPGSAVPGSTVTITATITNQGPDAATGVTFNDVVPAGATGIGATSTQGTCTPGATGVNCTIGSIPNGGSVTVTITFIAPATGGTNTATVSGAELDGDSSDNQVVSVIAAAAGDEASIPTLTEWMLLVLGLSIAIVAVRRL